MKLAIKEIEEKQFRTIDICKLIMAFAVIAIHTNPVVNVTNQMVVDIVVILEDFAVPFFFVASGFFLAYGMEDGKKADDGRYKRYFIKILRMYCIWTIISLPLTIYGYSLSGESVIHCLLSYVKYFLFVGKLYNSYHLWYLLALLYAVAMIWFLKDKKVSIYIITIVALLFFVMNEGLLWLGESANGVMTQVAKIYQYIFNKGGVFTGVIYVCMGMLMAQKKQVISKWICIGGLIIINIIQMSTNIHVSNCLNIVESAFFFMLVLQIRLPEWKYYKMCRKASTIVYLSHLWFFSIYTIVIIQEPNKLGIDSFLVTAIMSILNAVMLIRLSEKNSWKWIKKII